MLKDILNTIHSIHAYPKKGIGMDIIIVSVESADQILFWEERLNASRQLLIKNNAIVCCIREDWPGGAGNGLGSLYAFQKARDKILLQQGVDILALLQAGASIALYHTAGQGKRLFPLTASEGCNKAAVKLPAIWNGHFLSILEAVILQTGLFAPAWKGRFSVFWSDQLFIPSHQAINSPGAHIEVLAIVQPLPSEKEWEAGHLSNYGVLATDANKQTKDVEKCSYSKVKHLIETGKISDEENIGMSLGCFSLSFEMLQELTNEFSAELSSKKEKMDSDPFIWMPLTLDLETYLASMEGKGSEENALKSHYQRIQLFKQRFTEQFSGHLFRAFDIGIHSYWWDYGTVQSYQKNNLKLCCDTDEGMVMRAFFKMEHPVTMSTIRAGHIENSVVIGVDADYLHAVNCVILNAQLHEMEADGCLLYNVCDEGSQKYSSGTVRADILLSDTEPSITMMTSLERDGKEDWKEKLPGNPYSYQDIAFSAGKIIP